MRVDNSSHTLSSFLEETASTSTGSSAVDETQATDFQQELEASQQTEEDSGTTAPSSFSAAESTNSIVATALVSSDSAQSVPATGTTPTSTESSAADTTATAAAAEATDASSLFAAAASDVELDPSPAAPWPMTLVTPVNPPTLAGESKTALADALTNAGIDPSTVKVSYWEELVWFPGGNWINRSITVQTPNGQKMDFDAAATLRSPYVTADSVQQMYNV